jgi:hypothetical protein
VRKGAFRLRYEGVTAGIDATSVHLEARNGGLRLVEQNYEYDLLSQAKRLQKYIGREVGYRQPDGTVGKARLLAANETNVFEIANKIVSNCRARSCSMRCRKVCRLGRRSSGRWKASATATPRSRPPT